LHNTGDYFKVYLSIFYKTLAFYRQIPVKI